ncbi:hypothetical protein [Legionella sp. WA2022007384]
MTEYKESYIYCNTEDSKNLYYINSDGIAENVVIIDFNQFDKAIGEYNKTKEETKTLLLLTNDQLKRLITLNGGFSHLTQPESADAKQISDYYMQGDMEGSGLKFILGPIPFYDENDPEDYVETAFRNADDARGAYLDSQGVPAGISFYYRKDKPEQWLIIVTRNVHLPKDQHQVHILSSVDPRAFMVDGLEKVETVDYQSFPNAVNTMKVLADSPVGEIISSILNADGTIKKNAELLHELFTGRIVRDEPFDDDAEWMKLLQDRAEDIIKNPFIIELFYSIEHKKLSKDVIKACLDENSELSKKLAIILGNESLKTRPKIKKELLILTHNLYQLGCLDKFEKFVGAPEKNEDYFRFFNKLAGNEQNHKILKQILQDGKLDRLRSIHDLIQKSKNSAGLMRLLENSEHLAQLIDQLMGLSQFISKVQAANKPKNEMVLTLTTQFLLTYPDREINREVIGRPFSFLKDVIPNIEDLGLDPSRVFQLCKLKKLIGFLNKTPGIEKIKPELLLGFLSENIDNEKVLKSAQEALARLVELKISNSELYELALSSQKFREIITSVDVSAVQKTLAKLVELEISDSKSYEELVLKSEEFRKIVAALDVKDVKDVKEVKKDARDKCELAKNLFELGHLSAFSQISTNLEWVRSFNKLVKNNVLKGILAQKLDADNVAEACKPILDNSLLKTLVAANIGVTEEQVTKILIPKNELAKKLHTITKKTKDELAKKPQPVTKEIEGELAKREKALYQLAIDLDKLGVLGSFDEFKDSDSNSFLNLIHTFGAENEKLLKEMLAVPELAPGLGILRLIAYSGKPAEYFQNLVKDSSPNVMKLLNWLDRKSPSPAITSMAIEVLFKQPKIELQEFSLIIKFLQDTPKSNSSRDNMVDFLSKNYQNKELLSKVKAAYKTLDALDAGADAYRLAIEEKSFLSIVNDLPLMRVNKDQVCGLKRVDKTPAPDELRAYKSSSYIITKDNQFLYYNKTEDQLLNIQLEESQLKNLNEQFPSSIDTLTDKNLKHINEITSKKQRKNLIELAEKLSKYRLLDKYRHFGFDAQLASSFVKFIERPSINELLRDELSSEDFSIDRVRKILGNKRLITLRDANIDLSKSQLSRLLDPTSEKSRAMEILMSLTLNDEQRLAYQWALVDTPTAKNFRKVLFEIDGNKELELETKSKMIEALCSLQLGPTHQVTGKSLLKGRDVFSMFLNGLDERDLHLLPQLPADLTKYKGSYIYCNKDDVENRKLYYIKTRCDLHFLPELPADLTKYKGSYVYCGDGEDKNLHYIKPDGASEKVNITNFKLFDENLKSIKKQGVNTLHLTSEQVNSCITANGGHNLGIVEEVKMNDFTLLDRRSKQKGNPLHLTGVQIMACITNKGGHTPAVGDTLITSKGSCTTKGEKFRNAIFKIEETCKQIGSRLSTEAPDGKAKSFKGAEKEYRKGLYAAVFDSQDKPMSKKDFEARIDNASQKMLSVVDVKQRSWIIAIIETLAEALNIATITGLSRLSKGKTFFSRTNSGQEVRNLNESLVESHTDPKEMMAKYKREVGEAKEPETVQQPIIPIK